MSNLPMIFKKACVKTLSAVEARPERSNQHEFNGVAELKKIFGIERIELNAVFSILGEKMYANAGITWYDARENHETRSEHRLYFQSNSVMQQAKEGDNVLIGFDNDNTVHCVLIRSGSAEHNPGINTWKTV
ncbi:type II restriction endonuclease [Pseudomonas sp. Irchel 3F5]|uniref:type II restriction endonuclease n=1 Tax=Pseudomonas sp. Irchel 3F5 TaxID=2009002 RepID=UPI000BA4D33F|nr:type II restriction endonuclease [Pseudomonas sp. Irchel 3F5]